MQSSGGEELLKPTMIIRPPSTGPISVPAANKSENPEMAILRLERQIIEAQVQKQIAFAHQNGKASELKQLIVMSGPMDVSVSRSAKPPVTPEGKVALIGLPDSEVVGRSVEEFFGAPMTPEREKALLDTVKTNLADGKASSNVDVRIAGWWPNEGVMAVTVVPRS